MFRIALLPLLLMAQAATSEESLLQRIERGQRALIALTRINIDQTRLTALESERLRLLGREAEISGQQDQHAAGTPADSGSREPALISLGPGGETKVAPAGSLPAYRRETSRALAEIRRSREAIEQTIDQLRTRIAKWEKYLESLGETNTP